MKRQKELNMSEDKVVSLGSKKKDKEKVEQTHSGSEDTVKTDAVYCSFCGRPNTQVIKMIKGPGVNICSECVMIALQYLILQDRVPSAEAQQILNAFWGKAR